jgi:hypothetical protein
LRGKQLLFCAVVLVCLAAAFVVTWGYPPEARFFPIIVIGLCIVCVLWELAKAYRQKVEETQKADKGSGRKFIYVACWIVGFILILWLLGFNVGLPLFTFAYVKTHEKAWRWAILLPVITFVMSYVGFEILLQTPLYEGLLFQ